MLSFKQLVCLCEFVSVCARLELDYHIMYAS
jgi:hypothetical protein